MNRDSFILPPGVRPDWVEYPRSFCRIVVQLLVDITSWHILEGHRALVRFGGLSERYPSRKLFPFAYRQDNDDVARWAEGMGEEVFIIHDFACYRGKVKVCLMTCGRGSALLLGKPFFGSERKAS